MKIAIFGSNGMAGHVISRYLKEQGHSIIEIARNSGHLKVDFEDRSQVNFAISSLLNEKLDFIINCAGVLVQDSKNNPYRAIAVNSWFPKYLEHKLINSDVKLIHLSTDSLFDGKKGKYTETDEPTAKNTYGKSKGMGEVINDKDITLRVSIIGPEIKDPSTRSGLMDWVINNSETVLPGWENAWWNGITTLQLAKCIHKYVQDANIYGIYHPIADTVNKYQLLCYINDIYNLNKKIMKTDGPKAVDKTLVCTKKFFDFVPIKTQLEELKDWY